MHGRPSDREPSANQWCASACERRARPPSIVARPRVLPVFVRRRRRHRHRRQCSAVRCGAVRCCAVWCGAVRCCPVRCGAIRFDSTGVILVVVVVVQRQPFVTVSTIAPPESEIRNRAPEAVDPPSPSSENGGQRRPGPPHHRECRQHLRRGTCVSACVRDVPPSLPSRDNRDRRGAARSRASRSIDRARRFPAIIYPRDTHDLLAAASLRSFLLSPYLSDAAGWRGFFVHSCIYEFTVAHVPSDRLVFGNPPERSRESRSAMKF